MTRPASELDEGRIGVVWRAGKQSVESGRMRNETCQKPVRARSSVRAESDAAEMRMSIPSRWLAFGRGERDGIGVTVKVVAGAAAELWWV